MKHLFSIFSMLVLVALSVGCSDKNLMDSVDKEETVKRLYPTGEQKPVEVSEVYGHLSYDEEKKIWIISCLDFPLAGGDEVGVSLIAENIPNDFLDYSGKVCLKGVVTYLYTDVYTYSEFVMRRIVFYSLQVNRMEKVAESRSNSSNLICRTQAIDPPLWLNNPSSRTTNNNEYILNVFVHIIRTSSGDGNGLDKTSVSHNIVTSLNNYGNDIFVDTTL